MSPGAIVSIELLLDAAAEQTVRDEWNALAAAGLSSLAAHTAPSNRPHVTLLVRPRIPDFPVAALANRLPLRADLGAPIVFGAGDRRVLARSVIPSPELIAFHAALHEAAGAGDDAAHTRPGAWTPHVTLARRVRGDDLAIAVRAIGGEVRARAIALRRWDAASATVTLLGGPTS